MTGATLRNKAVAAAFFDAMSRGDVPAIVNAYAEDGTLQTMGNTLISGVYDKKQITNAAGLIFEAFPKRLMRAGLVTEAPVNPMDRAKRKRRLGPGNKCRDPGATRDAWANRAELEPDTVGLSPG